MTARDGCWSMPSPGRFLNGFNATLFASISTDLFGIGSMRIQRLPPMTDDLQDLYQEVILDHSRRPRNYGPLPQRNRSAEGYNPVCGDHYAVHLRTDGDRICEIRFEGSGCAISKASASIMTTVVEGRSVEEARRFFDQFHAIVTSGRLEP